MKSYKEEFDILWEKYGYIGMAIAAVMLCSFLIYGIYGG